MANWFKQLFARHAAGSRMARPKPTMTFGPTSLWRKQCRGPAMPAQQASFLDLGHPWRSVVPVGGRRLVQLFRIQSIPWRQPAVKLQTLGYLEPRSMLRNGFKVANRGAVTLANIGVFANWSPSCWPNAMPIRKDPRLSVGPRHQRSTSRQVFATRLEKRPRPAMFPPTILSALCGRNKDMQIIPPPNTDATARPCRASYENLSLLGAAHRLTGKVPPSPRHFFPSVGRSSQTTACRPDCGIRHRADHVGCAPGATTKPQVVRPVVWRLRIRRRKNFNRHPAVWPHRPYRRKRMPSIKSTMVFETARLRPRSLILLHLLARTNKYAAGRLKLPSFRDIRAGNTTEALPSKFRPPRSCPPHAPNRRRSARRRARPCVNLESPSPRTLSRSSVVLARKYCCPPELFRMGIHQPSSPSGSCMSSFDDFCSVLLCLYGAARPFGAPWGAIFVFHAGGAALARQSSKSSHRG